MNQTQKKLKLGIVGCGKVAHERHLPALNLLQQIQIVAAADSVSAHLNTLADQYNIPKRYTCHKDLIDDPNVDAVAVLTPTGTHVEIGLAVMEAEKHLFMEKPLALTLDDCDKLNEKSKTVHSKTMICFNLRWHRLVQQTRTIIRTGKLGTIKAICSNYTHFRDGSKAPAWHRTLNSGGGVTFNESVHYFDLWRYLLQTDVTDVFAFSTADQYYEDESSMITAHLANDCLASVYNTFKTSPNSEFEIFGTKGRLCVNLYRFDGIDFFPSHIYSGNIPARIKKMSQSMLEFIRAVPLMRRGGDFQATFYNIWQHFLDCVFNDKTPEASLEDGKHTIQISLAAIESFKTQKMVHVNG